MSRKGTPTLKDLEKLGGIDSLSGAVIGIDKSKSPKYAVMQFACPVYMRLSRPEQSQQSRKVCFVQLLPSNVKATQQIIDQDESNAVHLHDTTEISQQSFDVLRKYFRVEDVTRFSSANDVVALRHVLYNY